MHVESGDRKTARYKSKKVFVENASSGWHGWVSKETLRNSPRKYRRIRHVSKAPVKTKSTKAKKPEPKHLKKHTVEFEIKCDAEMLQKVTAFLQSSGANVEDTTVTKITVDGEVVYPKEKEIAAKLLRIAERLTRRALHEHITKSEAARLQLPPDQKREVRHLLEEHDTLYGETARFDGDDTLPQRMQKKPYALFNKLKAFNRVLQPPTNFTGAFDALKDELPATTYDDMEGWIWRWHDLLSMMLKSQQEALPKAAKVRAAKPGAPVDPKEVPDRFFAWPKERKYLCVDKDHAKAALKSLNTDYDAKRINNEIYSRAYKNIMKAYKSFGMQSQTKPRVPGLRPGIS